MGISKRILTLTKAITDEIYQAKQAIQDNQAKQAIQDNPVNRLNQVIIQEGQPSQTDQNKVETPAELQLSA